MIILNAVSLCLVSPDSLYPVYSNRSNHERAVWSAYRSKSKSLYVVNRAFRRPATREESEYHPSTRTRRLRIPSTGIDKLNACSTLFSRHMLRRLRLGSRSSPRRRGGWDADDRGEGLSNLGSMTGSTGGHRVRRMVSSHQSCCRRIERVV